jgi:hypothetical protein
VATYFKIPSIEGYDALYQSRYGEFIASASDGKIGTPQRSIVLLDKYGVYSEQMLALLGVRYLLHRLSDGRNVWAYPHWQFENYRSIYRDEHYEVFENTKALPRAFLASSYAVAQNDQQILDTLYKPDFDMRETVILEREPEVKPQAGDGSVEIAAYTPTHIRFRTESNVPKLLFLSDVFDSGWASEVDGTAVPTYRANYDFRAISVPPGKHEVTMKYRPESVSVGFIVAFIGLVGLMWTAGVKKTV